MLQKHIKEQFNTRKKKKLKNSLKSGTSKADFTSMIKDLGLYKANSDKALFIQEMVLNF